MFRHVSHKHRAASFTHYGATFLPIFSWFTSQFAVHLQFVLVMGSAGRAMGTLLVGEA
jgi:hypothetical protein